MTWIDNDNDFRKWCDEARKHQAIAIDTEFVWTKTFYPDLGLVQMAWDRDHPSLIDVLAIQDKTPLKSILEDSQLVKIFHEAASDLPILRRWTGGALPRNIFDTRIAGGFIGLTASLSLNKLLTIILGITLPKTETRTNWLQRPLTPAQLDYASGDVDYMPELYEKMHRKLLDNHNEPWFREEMKVYEKPEYYEEQPPEQAWRRVSGNGQFAGRNLAVIMEIATWRENYAREHNITKSRIITDEQITACAQFHPQNELELMKKANLWKRNAEKYADHILQAIQRAMQLPDKDLPHRHHGPELDVKTLRTRTERLKKLVAKRALEREIDPVLVAARKDMESFVNTVNGAGPQATHELLQGWKRELLGDTIQKLAETNFTL